MPSDAVEACLLCGTPPRSRRQPAVWVKDIDCPTCGRYFVDERDVTMGFNDALGQPFQRSRLSALLFERKTIRSNALPPVLVFHPTSPLPELPYGDPLRVTDFLATWPASVLDQLDRAISLLARMHPRPGDQFKPEDNADVLPARWLLAEDRNQASYVQDHLLKNQWIEQAAPPASNQNRRITPKGWERVAELTRRSALTNPAFVAMWFGRPDRVSEMTSRYETAILPAIKAAGYLAHRSDRDEHNEGIMDKIRFDIRRAPFVVADFTKHNRGVYYEAGLAMGHGIEVIHCCPDEEFDEKHFDIAHRNLIKYNSDDDLRVRLERRILGSVIGAGPFRENGAIE